MTTREETAPPPDLAELREMAEEIAAEEWSITQSGLITIGKMDHLSMSDGLGWPHSDYLYAARPTAVLAILSLVEKLTRERDEARRSVERYSNDAYNYAAKIKALRARVERLEAALTQCRAAIFSKANRESIVCTVWAEGNETLVDLIDAALSSSDAPRND